MLEASLLSLLFCEKWPIVTCENESRGLFVSCNFSVDKSRLILIISNNKGYHSDVETYHRFAKLVAKSRLILISDNKGHHIQMSSLIIGTLSLLISLDL